MLAIIDEAGRKFNADKLDGISRREAPALARAEAGPGQRQYEHVDLGWELRPRHVYELAQLLRREHGELHLVPTFHMARKEEPKELF